MCYFAVWPLNDIAEAGADPIGDHLQGDNRAEKHSSNELNWTGSHQQQCVSNRAMTLEPASQPASNKKKIHKTLIYSRINLRNVHFVRTTANTPNASRFLPVAAAATGFSNCLLVFVDRKTIVWRIIARISIANCNKMPFKVVKSDARNGLLMDRCVHTND